MIAAGSYLNKGHRSAHPSFRTNHNTGNQGVPFIATSLVRRYGGITNPISEYGEYTFAAGEMDLWKAHEADLSDAAVILRQQFTALFRDLLLLCWPDAARRTTSWSKLQALGLVVPVDDPDDF